MNLNIGSLNASEYHLSIHVHDKSHYSVLVFFFKQKNLLSGNVTLTRFGVRSHPVFPRPTLTWQKPGTALHIVPTTLRLDSSDDRQRSCGKTTLWAWPWLWAAANWAGKEQENGSRGKVSGFILAEKENVAPKWRTRHRRPSGLSIAWKSSGKDFTCTWRWIARQSKTSTRQKQLCTQFYFTLNKLKAPKFWQLKTGASVSVCTLKMYLNFRNRSKNRKHSETIQIHMLVQLQKTGLKNQRLYRFCVCHIIVDISTESK